MKSEMPDDTLFELLSHSYRRLLLECLDEHDGPITLPDAAEQVSCAAKDDRLANIEPEAVRRIYLNLYHSHVPQLVDADVVSYSQEADLIGLTEAGDELAAWMDRFPPDAERHLDHTRRSSETMTNKWNPDPRGVVARLQGAHKQLDLAREELDDEGLADDLTEALAIVESVQTEVSFSRDGDD